MRSDGSLSESSLHALAGITSWILMGIMCAQSMIFDLTQLSGR